MLIWWYTGNNGALDTIRSLKWCFWKMINHTGKCSNIKLKGKSSKMFWEESEFWNYTYFAEKKTTKENTTKDSLW